LKGEKIPIITNAIKINENRDASVGNTLCLIKAIYKTNHQIHNVHNTIPY